MTYMFSLLRNVNMAVYYYLKNCLLFSSTVKVVINESINY